MPHQDSAQKTRLPAVFLGHGTPMLALAEDAYTDAIHRFFSGLPKPRAIVVVSAYGTSREKRVEVSAATQPMIAYDFSGFPSELYQMDYSCPGDPGIAVQVASRLAEAGFQPELSRERPMDHGAWIPLRLAFPQADIPVIQISMPYGEGPANVLRLGKALAPLRDEGVLLVATGGVVHNMDKLVWYMKEGPGQNWAQEFQTWVKNQLQAKNVQALVDFEEEGPHAKLAQPTPEHFYPLFFTIGASLQGDISTTIFEGIQYQALSMFSFALNLDPKWQFMPEIGPEVH